MSQVQLPSMYVDLDDQEIWQVKPLFLPPILSFQFHRTILSPSR